MSDLLQPFWIDCFGECDTNENINLEIYMTSGSFYRVSSFKKSRRFVVLIILYQSSWGFLKIRKKISVQKPFQQTYVLMKTSWRRLSSSSSEDVLNTSSRLLDQGEFVRISLTSSEDVVKTSSRRLGQDQYIHLGHTSSRCVQDVFKTSSKRLAKTSLKRFQDVLKTVSKTSSRRLQDVLRTSSARLAKTFSRRFQDVSSS